MWQRRLGAPRSPEGKSGPRACYASLLRASASPMSAEHRGEAYTPNAATRSRGWSASEAGQRSFAV
jgi:hypothetical protein